jgi:hypothetical protein
MSYAARSRRLVAARRVGEPVATGLVWVSADASNVAIDPASLAEGALVVLDYTVVIYRQGDVCVATWCERVSRVVDDHGLIFAWDGRVIGKVRPGELGGVMLPFEWPAGLAFSPPAAEESGASDDARMEAARASRESEAERVAAELADVDRLRKAQV